MSFLGCFEVVSHAKQRRKGIFSCHKQNRPTNKRPTKQNKQADVLSKLQRLQEQRQSQKSNLTRFDGLVVVNVGVKPTEHFPKLKDSEGNKVKDENGKDKRSDVSDGWTYTFVEFGTAKVVKVVIPKLYELELLQPYQVSGYGYDIRNAGMVFIDSEGELTLY